MQEEEANLSSPTSLPSLPNDPTAEESVLASMLSNHKAIAAASEILTEDAFYISANKLVFAAIMALYNENAPVDAVTLANKLNEQGVFEKAGGLEHISILSANYYTSRNIAAHAKIVADKAVLRELIKAAGDINAAALTPNAPVDVVLEEAEKRIFSVSFGRTQKDFIPLSEIISGALDRIESAQKAKGKITGISTGFADLDILTMGMQNSDLILIGARPSMGKTAFLLKIALNASQNGCPTVIFSLEMSKEQLMSRLLSMDAKVDSQKLRGGNLSQEDWDKLLESSVRLQKAPLFIDDTSSISVGEARTKIRRLKLEKNLGLALIDYLQLMTIKGKRPESRQLEVSEISRNLKAIAKEINIPVLAAAQLNRAAEQRTNKRPILSDLRESGSIEQDADIVAFLHREYYYDRNADPSLAELIIAKQRNGPIGNVNLTYISQYTLFANHTGIR